MQISFTDGKAAAKYLPLVFACLLLPGMPAAAQQSQTKGEIVEEVVARVNNEIITRGDLDHAAKDLHDEIARDCAGCTVDQIEEKFEDAKKDLLRDLIDNSLLVQRGNDMGINVDTQVVKRLDEIRIQNNLDSLDDLERAVVKNGQDYQDFQNGIKDQLLQQEVIRREVGSRITVDHATVQKYYDDHKTEYVRPEQVVLREIFVGTDGKSDAETEALKKKADGLLVRIKNGDDFGELAKRFSDGSTAKIGGDLGTFGRDELTATLAPIVFKLEKNDVTDVLPAKGGYVIYQVQEHYPAGQQPESKVEEEITNRLYEEKLKPTMREYLKTLREDSYVQVKPSYVDTAAVSEATIDEVPATPDDTGKVKTHKKKNGA